MYIIRSPGTCFLYNSTFLFFEVIELQSQHEISLNILFHHIARLLIEIQVCDFVVHV